MIVLGRATPKKDSIIEKTFPTSLTSKGIVFTTFQVNCYLAELVFQMAVALNTKCKRNINTHVTDYNGKIARIKVRSTTVTCLQISKACFWDKEVDQTMTLLCRWTCVLGVTLLCNESNEILGKCRTDCSAFQGDYADNYSQSFLEKKQTVFAHLVPVL